LLFITHNLSIGGRNAQETIEYKNAGQVECIPPQVPDGRFGSRFDTLSMDDPGTAFAGTGLALRDDDPRRLSFMVDWSNSEFSRLRLQYTRDEAGASDDNQFGLQYTMSIGAHGAHSF